MQSNRFEVSGFLATRPVERTLPSGTPVANVRLGQTTFYETKEGRGQQTNWFNLVFYGPLAKIAVTYDKGDNINVVGSIQQRQFTPKDGSTRTVLEVVVQKCHRIAAPREIPPSPSSSVADAKPVETEMAQQRAEGNDAWTLL